MNGAAWSGNVFATLGELPPQHVLDLLATPHKIIHFPRQHDRAAWLGELAAGATILDTLKSERLGQ